MPEKKNKDIPVKDNEQLSDILEVEGINFKGFGTIPKSVMQDRRLNIESKSIYAYFCSYAGAGRQAFPSVFKITYDLCISRNRYYKYFKDLVMFGYIRHRQIKNGNRFSHNIFFLCPNPIYNPPKDNDPI